MGTDTRLMRFALIDFETESPCDLRKSGAWVYSEHACTNILCLGYTLDGAAAVVVPADRLFPLSAPKQLVEAVNDPAVIFIAHNCGFEKGIWRNIMVAVYGWPDIPNERWHDVMAVCAYKGLPLKLERAASSLRLSNRKDTEGTKATLDLGRTDKKGYYNSTPEKLQRVYDYNASDIVAELELHRRVRGLGASERQVWLLDQTINERGVRLDMEFVAAAQRVCDDAAKPLLAEFRSLTGIDKIRSLKLKDWLIEQGCPFPRDADGKPDTSLSKENVAKLLGDEDDQEDLTDQEDAYNREGPQQPLPFAYRRPLEILQIVGSASIKKLAAMQACCGSDGRAHGLLQYHGTGTGLWSGRLLQPQNFPRPSLKIAIGFDKDGNEIFGGHDPEQLVAAIKTRDAEYVRLMFGEPIAAVVSGLRHSIIASDGCLLESADLKQIQARIVLALAGQYDKVKLMEGGATPYVPMAESIFKRKINKNVDLKEYTIGKCTILGCGFGMGAITFRRRYCPNETTEYAQHAIDVYRQEFAPLVPKLWYGLEEAANKAVWDRRPQEAFGIVYQLEDGWLTARLPSGRKLWYYDPRPVRKAMPWDKDDIRPGFEYSCWKTGQWIRRTGYGGLETQNVVSGIARDLLVNGMFNIEKAGHMVVFNVHDENIAEVKAELADASKFDKYMTGEIPDWARALRIPVASDCWVGPRYRK
jgi:DNA polymerase